MPVTDVYNVSHDKVGSVDLDETIFATEVKEHLFHMVVRHQLAGRRQGTHSTRRRAEVAGGGRKPFKQKGTGRARQGSTRAPHYAGGGVVFGPQPRSHAFQLNKKVRRAALKCALSRRFGEAALFVVDDLAFVEKKTKGFRSFMKAFSVDSLLVVVPDGSDIAATNVSLVSRNIPGVTVLPVAGLNVYDVLRHRNIALTAPAIAPIVERLSR